MHSSLNPSLTEHIKRSEFLVAVARAIEFDGLPAPKMIGFEGNVARLVMEANTATDVEDWARHLGVEAASKPLLGVDAIRTTGDDMPEWHGYRLFVWCIVSKAVARPAAVAEVIHFDSGRHDQHASCGYDLDRNGPHGWTTDRAKVTCPACAAAVTR